MSVMCILAPRQNFAVRKLVFCSKGFTVISHMSLGEMDNANVNALSTVKTAKKSVQMHYQSHASVDFPNIV